VSVSISRREKPVLRTRLLEATPIAVVAPSLAASFVYVFLFVGWTFYISLSDSTLLPSLGFVGIKNYLTLWTNRTWTVAYTNLLFFSVFSVLGTMALGLLLAILIDQKVRLEAFWRTIFLYPMAVSFIVTGTVWSWLYNPQTGVQHLLRAMGLSNVVFALTTDRNTAIWAIIITGIWGGAGFAMALFLAGLRSVDQDIVKAAQIDGASWFRIYARVILPSIRPIFLAVTVVLLQSAIKTFELAVALTNSGPGTATTFPAAYVYNLLFTRGKIGEGAAAAVMIVAALAIVLVPYSLYLGWRKRQASST